MKKKILLLLALCFMLPISFFLTACGGIEQPPQEEMYSYFAQAREAWGEYKGSWSLDGTANVKFTQDGETSTDDWVMVNTYNNQTKEYVNAEILNDEVYRFTVVKKLPNETFENWSHYEYENKIVDASYIEGEYAQEFLELIPSGFDKTYETLCADLEEEETEIRNDYSQDGYSCNEVTFELTYEKISDSEYQCVLYRLCDYNEPESSGKKERTRSLTEYTYTFDANGLNSVSMDYEYHVWTFNASTNEQTSYVSEVQDLNYTFAKSYDTTAMGKVDLTGKTAPTEKVKQTLNVYLDGVQKYSESVEFGTDIDTIISTITPRENCTIGNKYLDENFTQAYVSGMKTSSTKTTNVYCVSKPNEGYALICNKYYVDNNGDYSLAGQRWELVEANETVELNPQFNDYIYCEVVKKNGEVSTEKTLVTEDEQVYFYEFYRDYSQENVGDVKVYINGELAKTFTDNNYYEDESVLDFVSDKDSSVTYAQDLTLSDLDYEVYLDEDFTQKADKFSRLGAGDLSLYIKINIEPTYVLVVIEDLAGISLYGSFADYMDADLFYEYYGDYFAFYPSTSLVGTINGVDFAESEYVIEDEGSYYLDLEGGKEYHIVVDTL